MTLQTVDLDNHNGYDRRSKSQQAAISGTHPPSQLDVAIRVWEQEDVTRGFPIENATFFDEKTQNGRIALAYLREVGKYARTGWPELSTIVGFYGQGDTILS